MFKKPKAKVGTLNQTVDPAAALQMHDNSVAECCWYYSQPQKQYEVQEIEQDEFLGSVKLRQQVLGFPP